MKHIYAISFLFFFSFLNAQITFEKGYFIDEKNNRTDCYINNVDWMSNPTEIEYKLNAEDITVSTATIKTVKEFGIDNISKYKRYTGKIERSSTTLSSLTKNQYPEWKEEVLFLKLLVEGEASLYMYRDENLIKYFYETAMVPLEQLVSIKYMNSNTTTNTNNQFRQQLFNNVKCGAMVENDFRRIDYLQRSLLNHFIKYNECKTGKVVNYDIKKQNKTFALKVTASLESGTIEVLDESTVYNVSTTIQKIYNKFGFEAEYFLPFNNNKWSLFVNPVYSNFKTEKKYTKPSGLGTNVNYIASVDYGIFEIPFGFHHYSYLKNGSRISYTFGALIAFDNDEKIDFDNSNDLVNARTEIITKSSNNLIFGIGYGYKKYSAELRLNTKRSLKDSEFFTANYSSIGIVFGYQFL